MSDMPEEQPEMPGNARLRRVRRNVSAAPTPDPNAFLSLLIGGRKGEGAGEGAGLQQARRHKPWTPRRLHLLSLLSMGLSVTQAAREAKYDERSVRRILATDVTFRERLAEAMSARSTDLNRRLTGSLDVAVSTLRNLLVDPDATPAVKLMAADKLLRHQEARSEYAQLKATLERLEGRLDGDDHFRR